MNIDIINQILNFNIDYYVTPIICIYTYLLVFLFGLNIKIDKIPCDLNRIKFIWNNLLFQYNFIGALGVNLFILHKLEYNNSLICKKITDENTILLLFYFNKIIELFNIFFYILENKSLYNLLILSNPIILMISWILYVNEYKDIYYFIYFNYFIYTFIYLYKLVENNYQKIE